MIYCYSCSIPLNEETWGPIKDEMYCHGCTTETGEIQSKEHVQQWIAGWLANWQDGVTMEQAQQRAAHFMKAMPAWAED